MYIRKNNLFIVLLFCLVTARYRFKFIYRVMLLSIFWALVICIYRKASIFI